MEELSALLKELIALQQTSIRLQKFSITLAAESAAYLNAMATSSGDQAAVERHVLKAVKEIQGAMAKIEAGAPKQK